MRQSIADLAAALTAFYAKNDAAWAAAIANQTNSDALVAAAVAASQAGDDVDILKLQADLAAEAAKVPAPPVAPPVPTDTA